MNDDDITGGSLDRMSYLRPTFLFTIAHGRIEKRIGRLIQGKVN